MADQAIRLSIGSDDQPDDWVTVNPSGSQPEPNDWQTISAPQVPSQPAEPGLLEQWNNLWINRPLSYHLTGGESVAPKVSQYFDDPAARTEDQWKIPEAVPFIGGGTFRSLFSGMGEGLVNVGESLTTPLNVATAGAAGTYSRAAKTATTLPGLTEAAYTTAPKVAEAARRTTQALSAPLLATGGARVAEGIRTGNWQDVPIGAAEAAAGVIGLRLPRTVPPRPRQAAAPIEAPAVTPEVSPVIPQEPAPIEAPVVEPPTPEPQAVFDPNTLVGLRRSTGAAGQTMHWTGNRRSPRTGRPEMQFISPETGQIKPASQAVPGDVPLIPQRPAEPTSVSNQQMFELSRQIDAENRPTPPVEEQLLPHEFSPDVAQLNEQVLGGTSPRFESALPVKRPSFAESVKNFMREESGEFDPSSVSERFRRIWADRRFDINHWVNWSRRGHNEPLSDYATRLEDRANSAEGYGLSNEFMESLEEPIAAIREKARQAREVTDSSNRESLTYDPYYRPMRQVEPTTSHTGGPEDFTPPTELRIPEPVVRRLDGMSDARLESYINRNQNSQFEHVRDQVSYALQILEERRNARSHGVGIPDSTTPEFDLSGITDESMSTVSERIRSATDDELRRFISQVDSTTGVSSAVIRARNYADDIIWDRIHNTNTAIEPNPADWQPQSDPWAPPKGKTLKEVEAAKNARTPALERLGKIIGEDIAQELHSGAREIKFSESARYGANAPKRFAKADIDSWNRWAEGEISAHATDDPSKPGLTIQTGAEAGRSWAPDSLEMVYRNAEGEPIGILITDSSGKAISTLAVTNKLGLGRGKVMVKLLREAYKRGINEPSGGTSMNTKNFIERIKNLARNESGEFDPSKLFGDNIDRIADKINKIIDDLSGSKVGRAASRFIRDVSGEIDIGRLQALFNRRKAGTITPDEAVEFDQLARRFRDERSRTQNYQTYMRGTPQVSTGPLDPANVRPAENLGNRIRSMYTQGSTATGGGQPPAARTPRTRTGGGGRPPRPPMLNADQIDPNIPIQKRKPLPALEQSKFGQLWNAPRSMQSVDLPGITSAALRQSRPLAFTSDWFRAWGTAVKAFGDKAALDAVNDKISNSKYFRPRYQPVVNRAGEVVKYIEKPSIAEELGVKMTDVINTREEAIVSSLAEKIPGYGRYVTASNRAYTAFLNDLRAAKFEQLMDGAKAKGRNPEVDQVLGKKLADYVNNATGRGSLKYFGEKLNLEPLAAELGYALYSPRALSARLSFMNPFNYTMQDPLVRAEYWKSLARIGVSWGAFAGLGSLLPSAHVSLDPNNADFGKIRIGNTRIDPGGGWQQLMVLTHRMLPQVLGGGGTVSSTGRPGMPGKFTEFGSSPMAANRLSLPGRYLYNQLNPSLRFITDMLIATQKDPVDLTDRTIQLALPMYATDIAEAAKGDPIVAEFFAPLLSSMGAGVQTYDKPSKGGFNKPVVTPAIEKLTGIDVPTIKVGR